VKTYLRAYLKKIRHNRTGLCLVTKNKKFPAGTAERRTTVPLFKEVMRRGEIKFLFYAKGRHFSAATLCPIISF